jgi:hypothetical protein
MLRLIPVLLIAALMACNSKSPEASKKIVTDSVASTWTADGENEIMDACIENAKQWVGEDTAYRYCKCVVQQVKHSYPNMDSAAGVMADSARVAKLFRNCK